LSCKVDRSPVRTPGSEKRQASIACSTLGSANGAFVNVQKVADPVVLTDGDRVRFSMVEFVVWRLVWRTVEPRTKEGAWLANW
jgi:pSer/pThr/pTyr-binding forkhead associated (FHA) protein